MKKSDYVFTCPVIQSFHTSQNELKRHSKTEKTQSTPLACLAPWVVYGLAWREVYFRNGVTIRAMGAAIEKAVRLAVELQRRNYSLGILTGTAEVVDDVIPDDNVQLSFFGVGLILGYGVG